MGSCEWGSPTRTIPTTILWDGNCPNGVDAISLIEALVIERDGDCRPAA
jgi:hypothetical protein